MDTSKITKLNSMGIYHLMQLVCSANIEVVLQKLGLDKEEIFDIVRLLQ